MTRAQIIEKIQKCLRLSKSANEHEAAIALRQAQLLMEAHTVSGDELQAAEACEARAQSNASEKPPLWENHLAAICGQAFACDVIFSQRFDGVKLKIVADWRFVGIDAAPPLCEYAFTVLFRKARDARAEYMAKKLSRCGRRNKVARADEFAAGWVSTVSRTVHEFARTPEQQAIVDAYLKQKVGATRELKATSREVSGQPKGDWSRGRKAADGIRLDRPVDGSRGREALS